LLRPLQASDADQIQRLFPQWRLVQYMAVAIPWPYPAEGAREHLDRTLPKIENREEYHWAIVERSDASQELIGCIALTPDGEEDHRGFWLAESYWGRGLMTEAVTAVNDFAFDVLNMPEMILNNAEPNLASHRIKASSGAEIISVGEADFVGGRFRCVKWKLTPEAWQRSKLTRT
jgi:RimJ/RimL family protein N-acetyltransferase